MPSVPRKTAPEVRSRAQIVTGTPALRQFDINRIDGIDPRAFGVDTRGLGRQTAQFGGRLADIAIRRRAEDSERKAKELDMQFQREKNLLLYGDGTEENPGFYSLKGGAAIEAAPEVQEQLDSLRQSISDSAERESIRRMFDGASQQRLLNDINNMNRHTGQERISANIQTSEARIQTSIDEAALNYPDENVNRQAKAVIAAEIQALGELQGWSEEVINQKTVEATTALVNERFNAALAQRDYDAAQQIIQENVDSVDPAVVARMQEKLEVPMRMAKAQAVVDEMIAMDMSEKEMLRIAREEEDPFYRDELVRRIKTRTNERETGADTSSKELYRDWHSEVINGADLETLIAEDPDGWAAISRLPNQVRGLYQAEELRSEGKVHPITSSQSVVDMFATMSREELSEVDPTAYKSLLTKEDWDRLVTQSQSARNYMEGTEKIPNSVFNAADRIIVSAFPELDPEDSNKDIQAQIQILRSEMDRFILEFTERENRPPNISEMRDHAQMLSAGMGPQGETETGFVGDVLGWSWMSEQIGEERSSVIEFETVVEALATQEDPEALVGMVVPFDELPRSYVRDATETIKQYRGRDYNPSEEEIEELATAWILRDGDRMRAVLQLPDEPDQAIEEPARSPLFID